MAIPDPVCPACVARPTPQERPASPLQRDNYLWHCTNPACRAEFPVIDGVPILAPSVRNVIAQQMLPILARDDLPEIIESLIGDCCGPSTYENLRLHLSSYTWDHYGEFDPAEVGEPRPGEVVRALSACLDRVPTLPTGPVLDVGCAVGRTTLHLADRLQRSTLGVDLQFAALRLARRVLHDGRVRYARRRIGLVYDRREFAVPIPELTRERVAFWLADATALPTPAGSFALAVAMNVFDAVPDPSAFLRALASAVRPGGVVVIACPYDWTASVTNPAAWVGGHSQRSEHAGSAEVVLRALLTPGGHPASVAGLRLVDELADVPWQVRLHDRSTVAYRLHAVIAVREGQGEVEK